jgi:hypothetical protein
MGQITTIGLDLAKNVFQVHGIDEADGVVVRLNGPPRRPPPPTLRNSGELPGPKVDRRR